MKDITEFSEEELAEMERISDVMIQRRKQRRGFSDEAATDEIHRALLGVL